MWLDRAIVLGYAVAAGPVRGRLHDRQRLGLRRCSSALYGSASVGGAAVDARRSPPASSGPRAAGLPGAGGSGIPQVKAALHPALPPERRGRFVSLRLTLAKIGLARRRLRGRPVDRARRAVGAGRGRRDAACAALAVARHHASTRARCWWPAARPASPPPSTRRWPAWCSRSRNCRAGIEARASGLIITAIVLAGLVAVSVFGNLSYFGVIQVPRAGLGALLGPGLVVALVERRGGRPVRAAADRLADRRAGAAATAGARAGRCASRPACGLAIAVIGLVTGGATFGAGSEAVKEMLAGHDELHAARTRC